MNSLTPKANPEDLDAFDTPAGSMALEAHGIHRIKMFVTVCRIFYSIFRSASLSKFYYSSFCWRCRQPFSHPSSLPEYLRHVEAPWCRPAPRHAAKDEICSVEEHGHHALQVEYLCRLKFTAWQLHTRRELQPGAWRQTRTGGSVRNGVPFPCRVGSWFCWSPWRRRKLQWNSADWKVTNIELAIKKHWIKSKSDARKNAGKVKPCIIVFIYI
jgi:hypothetical protein